MQNNWSSFLIINCPCSEAIADVAYNHQALRSHDKNNILTDHCQIKYKQKACQVPQPNLSLPVNLALFKLAAVVPWTGVEANNHYLTGSQLLLKKYI